MQFVRKILRKLKKIPDMKKEKVYNEAVNGDEGSDSVGMQFVRKILRKLKKYQI